MGKLDDILGDAKKKSSEIWGSVKTASKDKLKSGIQNLNDALPDLEAAGFVLIRMDVDVSLLPRIFARFNQVREISEEEKEAILAKTKPNKFLHYMLVGLFKAVEIRKEVQIDNMDLREIELEIGLTPSAKLIFRRENRTTLLE